MARTVLPIIALPTQYSMTPQTITWTAADAVNLNSFSSTGKELLLVRNADVGVNAVYTVTIGAATGGTFTLTVGGQTTAGIAYNATAIAVENALEALSTVGQGNVTVSGNAGGPYTVTFVSALGAQPVALTGSGTGLTGGAFAVTSTTTGVAAAAHTLTVRSSGDIEGRTGDITNFSVPANSTYIFQQFPVNGWRQADGTIWVDPSVASLQFVVIRVS